MTKKYPTEKDVIKNIDDTIDDINISENDKANEVDDADITNSCDGFQKMDVGTKKITINDIEYKWDQVVCAERETIDNIIDNIYEKSTGKKLAEDYEGQKFIIKLFFGLVMLVGFIISSVETCHN
jgi:hypothetical protein